MSTYSNDPSDRGENDSVTDFQYPDLRAAARVSTIQNIPAADNPNSDTSSGFSAPTNLSGDDVSALIKRAKEEGRQEAQAQLRDQIDAAIAAERSRIVDALIQFQAQRSEYYNKVESELIHLALSIAAKILHREAQVDRTLLAGLARVAMESLQAGTTVTLRVPQSDLSEWGSYFSERGANNLKINIVEDERVEPDNCVIETELGSAELGIEAQLKEIERGFFDLLARRPEGS